MEWNVRRLEPGRVLRRVAGTRRATRLWLSYASHAAFSVALILSLTGVELGGSIVIPFWGFPGCVLGLWAGVVFVLLRRRSGEDSRSLAIPAVTSVSIGVAFAVLSWIAGNQGTLQLKWRVMASERGARGLAALSGKWFFDDVRVVARRTSGLGLWDCYSRVGLWYQNWYPSACVPIAVRPASAESADALAFFREPATGRTVLVGRTGHVCALIRVDGEMAELSTLEAFNPFGLITSEGRGRGSDFETLVNQVHLWSAGTFTGVYPSGEARVVGVWRPADRVIRESAASSNVWIANAAREVERATRGVRDADPPRISDD